MKKIYQILCIIALLFSGTNLYGGTCDDHEYVDLGLPSGTLWATCNIGAESPEDYGEYFAWGEITGYISETANERMYDWSQYKWCYGSQNSLTKYCTNSTYGTVDNKIILDDEDDAATYNWGDKWCMPTHAQMLELINNTNTSWTKQMGVNGYKFTSKKDSSKYIFLPAAGSRYNYSPFGTGYYAYYWSKELHSVNTEQAWRLSFGSDYLDADYGYARDDGHTVRPVRCKNIKVDSLLINSYNLSLEKGDDALLEISVLPDDATDKSVVWSSNNESVAVVDEDGAVTGVGAGTATITATANDGSGVTASCTINVYLAESCDDHEYVDLGLSSGTLWAACNVGASSPEEYGDYYAWGETETKSLYTWANYQYSISGSSSNFSKYTTGKATLDEADDVATTLWGKRWQMPTPANRDELREECTWTWMSLNGVTGYKVTGPNGNFIFLPAVGMYESSNGGKNLITEKRGVYWLKTLTTTVRYGDNISFSSTSKDMDGYDNRANGCAIRPVKCKKSITLTDGIAYTNTEDDDYDEINYVRNFDNTSWQALYLPFAMNYDDWCYGFDVAAINNFQQMDTDDDGVFDQTTLEIIKVKDGNLYPNHPYLIRAKQIGKQTISVQNAWLEAAATEDYTCCSMSTNYIFRGTYSEIEGTEMLNEGYYALGEGSLHQAGSTDNSLSPYRWYLKLESRGGQTFSSPANIKVHIIEDGETGIESVNFSSSNVYYDLSGRQVHQPNHGIYLHNGKKICIK